jgi:colanic acid biosynthesis glycosyl transferase WcaI
MSSVTRERRPHLLVFNQYYWPGVEATGQLLAQLCADLADDFDVTVITGRLAATAGGPGRTAHLGVDVIRVRSTAFPRRILALRALNYVSFLAAAAREARSVRAPDVVLCMTDPPVVANIAVLAARRANAPLVVITQDVFPDIAVLLNRIQNPVVVAALRFAIRYYLRRADRVVAIGETMRTRLVEKGAPPDRVRVISNWVDTNALSERERGNAWAAEAGLAGHFIVMHSGNVGYTQDLDTLVRAATFLRDPARDGPGALPALPAPRSARAVALGCRHPRRGPRTRLVWLRRAKSPLRRPSGGSAGDRCRRRGQ